jgi:hypothetical protein
MPVEMPARARALLYARVLWELIRYDLLFACRGLQAVRPRRCKVGQALSPANRTCGIACGAGSVEIESAICEAVRSMAPFYWKTIRCLQRSIVTARLMQRRGIPADVVVGYRAVPFFSHAWVEVAGRAANDSPTYRMRLQVLERL